MIDEQGERIKMLRRRAGLRQSDLAELVGLKRNSIYSIEAGRQSLTSSVAELMAPALNVPLAVLYGLGEPPETPPLRTVRDQLTLLTARLDVLANETSRALKDAARLDEMLRALEKE